jgi:hypothetical protein
MRDFSETFIVRHRRIEELRPVIFVKNGFFNRFSKNKTETEVRYYHTKLHISTLNHCINLFKQAVFLFIRSIQFPKYVEFTAQTTCDILLKSR